MMVDRVLGSYGGLFSCLGKRCSPREQDRRTVSECKNDLTFTEEFWGKYGLDFIAAKRRLENTGGYRDCEVLMNSTETISYEEIIPRSRPIPTILVISNGINLLIRKLGVLGLVRRPRPHQSSMRSLEGAGGNFMAELDTSL